MRRGWQWRAGGPEREAAQGEKLRKEVLEDRGDRLLGGNGK